jgi:hypothetical protein
MKQKLHLSDIASELARLILKSIRESLNDLEECGVDPDSQANKLEILILNLFVLKVAAQEGLRHIQKNYVDLLFYTEQNLKATYVEVWKYGTADQFETTLQQRYREYDGIMKGPTTTYIKLRRIGLSFADHIGAPDVAVVSWASAVCMSLLQSLTSNLNKIDSHFELVSEASEEHKVGNVEGAQGGAGCLVALLILIGFVIIGTIVTA